MLGISNYLWRLIPANPLFLRVVLASGKRQRDMLIRSAYLGSLVFLVVFLLLGGSSDLGQSSLSALSRQSANIFYWMSYAQLTLVALLAPVFTAGAITQETDSQTYEILLSTPLTNGQIVLGAMLSRLFFVVSLLLSGIPVFAITQVFGGVAIQSIAMSCLIAMATAFATGALAMAVAVLKVGAKRGAFGFFMFILAYLAIPLILDELGVLQYRFNPDTTGKAQTHISWLAAIHPFLALRTLFGQVDYRAPEPGTLAGYGTLARWWLSSPVGFYIWSMFILSLVLVLPGIILLRRLAQATLTPVEWLKQAVHLGNGRQNRTPRRVWNNPIAWREARTRASSKAPWLGQYGFMAVALVGAVVLLVMSNSPEPARCHIGVGAYNASDNTIILITDDQPAVYALRQARAGRSGAKIVLEGKPVEPDALRQGMVVDPNNILIDPGSRTKEINSLTVSYPVMSLSGQWTRQFLVGAVALELAMILLMLAQSAASTVSRERESGTLDLLLATPITSYYYIWGKLRGLVSFAMPLLAVPIVSLLLFVAHDLFSSPPWLSGPGAWMVFPEALLVLPGTLLMAAAFAAIVGMQMSLRCRGTVAAVMSTVGIITGVCGGLWLVGSAAASSSSLSQVGVVIGCFSPFTLVSLLINPAAGGVSIPASGLTEYRTLVFICGWVATGCYALVVWTMYKSMVRNFDMTIRKQG